MSDFKTALIEVIQTAAPELEGKIQCGAVDEVEVYDNRVAGAELLKRKVRGAIEGLVVDGKVCRHRSSSSDYYPDYDLHSWTLTFKIQ